MNQKTASAIMLTLLLTSMLTLAFNIQTVKAEPAPQNLVLSTVIFDEFNFDTIASGYWEYQQVNGDYNISDSQLRLYIKSEGPHYGSFIQKAVSLGENMTLSARVLGSTLYRFSISWHLSDRYVLLEFDDFGFCVTTMIIPTLTWGWVGQFGPSPAVTNTWYILSLEIRPTPFTIIASVYDNNSNLLGSLTSDLGWSYSDIKMMQLGVWTNTISNSPSDYHTDWVKVTGYYPPYGPTADFIYSPPSTAVNEVVTFDPSPSQPGCNGTHIRPITTCTWSFGDNTPTLTTTYPQPVTHIYTKVGKYNVTLTVTAPGAIPETDTTWHIKEVVGLPPRSPIAKFTEIPETPYAYQPVYFDASTSQPGFDGDDECPITEYHWNFGDGQTLITTTSTARHVYQNGGNYTVTLTVYAPDIPPYIDPQYVGTNATGTTQEAKYVIPVGGYSIPIQLPTKAQPVTIHIALLTILTAIFLTIKRKAR
jgi:PKD repeat protein